MYLWANFINLLIIEHFIGYFRNTFMFSCNENLIYLPLIHLDIILGMNWLEFNHVYINCFDKIVLFPKLEERTNLRLISAGQVEMSLKENDQMFVMSASLRMKSDVEATDIPMVCEFPDVFPKVIRAKN